MQNTTNYNLKKFEDSDNADLPSLCENFDIIDEAMEPIDFLYDRYHVIFKVNLAGTTSALTATCDKTLTAYIQGMVVIGVLPLGFGISTNTITLQIDGLAAKRIYRYASDGTLQPLIAGQLKDRNTYIFTYCSSGSGYWMISQLTQPVWSDISGTPAYLNSYLGKTIAGTVNDFNLYSDQTPNRAGTSTIYTTVYSVRIHHGGALYMNWTMRSTVAGKGGYYQVLKNGIYYAEASMGTSTTFSNYTIPFENLTPGDILTLQIRAETGGGWETNSFTLSGSRYEKLA